MDQTTIRGAGHALRDSNDMPLGTSGDGIKTALRASVPRAACPSSPQPEHQECEICVLPYDKDRKPRPCIHCKKSFCKDCWAEWISTQPKINGNRAVTCPNCRREVFTPEPRPSPKYPRHISHGQRAPRDTSARARQRMDRRRSIINPMMAQRQSWHAYTPAWHQQTHYNSYNSPWSPAAIGLAPPPAAPYSGPYGLSPAIPMAIQYATYNGQMIYQPRPPMEQGVLPLYNSNQGMYTVSPPTAMGPTTLQPPTFASYGQVTPQLMDTLLNPRHSSMQRWQPASGQHLCPAMNAGAQHVSQSMGTTVPPYFGQAAPGIHYLPARPQPPTGNGVYLPPPSGMYSGQIPHTLTPNRPAMYLPNAIPIAARSPGNDTAPPSQANNQQPQHTLREAWRSISDRSGGVDQNTSLMSRLTRADYQQVQPTFAP